MTTRSNRVGLGVGLGKGYRNLAPADSHIHFLSAKGIKIFKPFSKSMRMSHNPLELTLYVPSTQGEEKLMDTNVQQRRIEDAEGKMSKIFGGTTQVSAVGRWYDDHDKFVKEPIGKVTSFTTPRKFERGKRRFESYVRDIAKRYNQKSLTIEYEGDMFFYANPEFKEEKK